MKMYQCTHRWEIRVYLSINPRVKIKIIFSEDEQVSQNEIQVGGNESLKNVYSNVLVGKYNKN